MEEFWIGHAPVTNAEYKRFLDANPDHKVPKHWSYKRFPTNKADHPAVNVSWDDAQDFCIWAGLRLPQGSEWEKAARGTDGRLYPWGEELPKAHLCNFGKQVGNTTPVGRYSPRGNSPYGCVDMAGNVWEWTASRFDNEYILRGGSWFTTTRDALRTTFWHHELPDLGSDTRGFHVCAFTSEL